MPTSIRLLLGGLAIALVSSFFAVITMAADSTSCRDSTPPATWRTPAGGEAKDVLGGKAGSNGTATVTNDGPGAVEVSTPKKGGGTNTVIVPPNGAKHIQVLKGEKVDITSTEGPVGGKDSAGTVVFTPNCGAAGSQGA
jgi:hypothetical protein